MELGFALAGLLVSEQRAQEVADAMLAGDRVPVLH